MATNEQKYAQARDTIFRCLDDAAALSLASKPLSAEKKALRI